MLRTKEEWGTGINYLFRGMTGRKKYDHTNSMYQVEMQHIKEERHPSIYAQDIREPVLNSFSQ